MGVSRNGLELARKFEAMVTATEHAQAEAVQAGAQAVKDTVLPLMVSATGGDLMLSGTGRVTAAPGSARKYQRKERKVGVRYRIVSSANDRTVAVVGATGPAQLIENDIPRHYVFSRFARAEGAGRRSASYKTEDGRRVRVDTRSAAKIFGVAVTGDRRAVIKFDGVVRRWTTSRSTGRHPWRRGVATSRQRVGEVWTTAHRRALVETFRG